MIASLLEAGAEMNHKKAGTQGERIEQYRQKVKFSLIRQCVAICETSKKAERMPGG